MRPAPFQPEPFENTRQFVRDAASGEIWHKVFHRTLYADTDRSGVVYHANYLRFFELGRTSLMRDQGYPYKEVEDKGYVYPIVELGVTYHSPLFYDDAMWVYTRPAVLERVRVQFDYLILSEDNSRLLTRGFTRHCALNTNGRPVAIDPDTVALWKGFPNLSRLPQ